jgi:uncharacterized integral membrane protein (TIGR00698 family)
MARSTIAPALRTLRSALPGLAVVAVCVAAAYGLSRMVTALSPLVAAVAIGALLANLGLVPGWARPGMRLAAKRLLRLGVVLLGFQHAVGEVLRLGGPGLAVVAVVVAGTFFGTQWLGARLGVSPGLRLLIATGFSICGASAIAAVEGVADAEEEEVALSIALVTLCGSLAIVLLPLVGGPIGLHGSRFGAWVGASVHDVAQVVATASTGGPASLRSAVVVKLTRVILLAPMVAGLTLARRRRSEIEPAPVDARSDAGPPAGSAGSAARSDARFDVDSAATPIAIPPAGVAPARRPPVMPLFVVGFLAAATLRSASAIPAGWLPSLKTAETLLLAAALVGLGTGVDVAKLRRLGGRPLVLALSSWVLIAVVAYGGVRLFGA